MNIIHKDTSSVGSFSKETLNDSAISFKYKNAILSRRNGEFAFKFQANEIKTNQSKTIDKCVLFKHRNRMDYETLAKKINLKDLNLFKKLVEAFNDENFAYFIWEKDNGMELYEYLRILKGRNYQLKLAEVGSFIAQLAIGVNFLHSNNFLHGFLNTTDIYYYSNGFLKIAGFYNFEVITDAPRDVTTTTAHNKRKLFYKCLQNEMDNIDFKYDNWSLGWILLEICTYANQRAYLEKVPNFLNLKKPDLPVLYKELVATYQNLTQIDKERRKPLTELLEERQYLLDHRMKYESMIGRLEKINTDIRYLRVTDFLGAGACGVTYKVKDTSDNTDKALKMIQDAKDRDIEEAELLRDLKHENIAEYFDHFMERDSLYLVTELCNGNNLQNYIDKSKITGIPKKRVLDWSRQLFEGINYAHSINIIHRDLKPDNIMLSYDEESERYTLKIIDFGFARKLDINFQARTFCGTPCYMAPEIFRSPSPYDNRADVWSAGCIIYEMIELKRAYDEADHKYPELVRKIGDPEKVPKIKSDNFMKRVLDQTFIHEYTLRKNSNHILQEIKKVKINESI